VLLAPCVIIIALHVIIINLIQLKLLHNLIKMIHIIGVFIVRVVIAKFVPQLVLLLIIVFVYVFINNLLVGYL